MINNRKLFAARKIYFFEVIAYLYGLNHLSWEIKTNENAFEKKGKILQSIHHKAFCRVDARRTLRQENSWLTSKKIRLLDFESTVTLGYGRFCLIKTCLSPSRKPLLWCFGCVKVETKERQHQKPVCYKTKTKTMH